MNGEWVLANKCPHCGGRMTLSSFYTYAREYPILKNGKMAKRGRRAEEEGIGFITAYCGSCHVAWDASNTFVNADGTVEISGNGEGWEENGRND